MGQEDEIGRGVVGFHQGPGTEVLLGLHGAGEERVDVHEEPRRGFEDEMALLEPCDGHGSSIDAVRIEHGCEVSHAPHPATPTRAGQGG